MATRVESSDINPDYPGSDNHLKLKDKSGGDPNHAEDDIAGVSSEVVESIENSEAETALSDKLKTAVSKDD